MPVWGAARVGSGTPSCQAVGHRRAGCPERCFHLSPATPAGSSTSRTGRVRAGRGRGPAAGGLGKLCVLPLCFLSQRR